VSNAADEELAHAFGIQTVRHRNEPLGAKFNAALRAARELDHPDYVLIMGSDDFFCGVVADVLAAMAAAHLGSLGLQDLYFADLDTGVMGYWPGYHPVVQAHRQLESAGCGRLLDRHTLEAVDWSLWQDDRHKGMDLTHVARMQECGAWPVRLINVKALGGVAIDCKTAENLWSFQEVGPLPLRAKDTAAIWAKLPPEIVAVLPGRRTADPAVLAAA
jgi:hypothetical protein